MFKVQSRRYLWALVFVFAAGMGSAAEKKKGEHPLKTLPQPDTEGTVPLEKTILERRSVRAFESEPLTDEQISQLLWSAQGITEQRRHLRAAPSAGATYPLETYLVTREGIHRYLPEKHALEVVKQGDARKDLAEAALGQSFIEEAPVTIAFTAIPERTTNRYGKRGVMYIHMEAGHAAQNVHLQAVALGLGSVPVGAFRDAEVERILQCRKDERALYLVPVGKPGR